MRKTYRVNGKTPRERQIEFWNRVKDIALGAVMSIVIVGCTLGVSDCADKKANAESNSATETETEIQQYIARYGYYDEEIGMIETTDGNLWEVTDMPDIGHYVVNHLKNIVLGNVQATETDYELFDVNKDGKFSNVDIVQHKRQELYILFDSNGTVEAEDYIIIDVMER